jgi:exosortase
MTGVERPDWPGATEKAPSLLAAHARALLLGGIVLGVFGFCYADVFRILWIQWNTNEANSHGFLIPWISLYVLWVRRERLATLRPDPVWWAGLLLLVPSLGVLLVGRIVGVVGLQEVSIVVSLWGLVLLLIGWRGLRELWFPIAYLLFMMPIWDLATEPMYHPLQMFAATLGTQILTFVGVPIFQDGTFLHLPETSVEVAYACSGINFLMSVLAIGILLAYVSLHGVWRRLVLILGSVVVALLANPLRVALIVYSYYSGLATPRQSHMWQGMVVSFGAFALLFAAASWLNARGQETKGAATTKPSQRQPVGTWLFALACACLLTGGILRPLERPVHSLAALRLASIPLELDGWHAGPWPPTGESFVPTIAADELWREYRGPAGEVVQLYVGRLAHQLPGAVGETYVSDSFWGVQFVSVPVRGGEPLSAKSAVIRTAGAQQATVVYWYQLGRFASTNRTLAKVYEARSILTGDPGPILVAVLVSASAGNTESAHAALGFSSLAATLIRHQVAF